MAVPIEINPNRPTQQEVAAHNMKIAKANLACELAKACCANPSFADSSADEIVNLCIGVAEGIIEKYTLMPDGAGNKGGLT